MLTEQNEIFDDCATTLAQFTEDEKIRMQCEARNDYIAREKGLVSRVMKQVTQDVSIEIACNLLDVLDVQIISLKTGLSVEQIEKLKG